MKRTHNDRVQLIERLERKNAKKLRAHAQRLRRLHRKRWSESLPDFQLRIGLDLQEPADFRFPRDRKVAY